MAQGDYLRVDPDAELKQLRAEIERLRALLVQALPYVDGPTEPGPNLRAAINEAIGGKVKDGSG